MRTRFYTILLLLCCVPAIAQRYPFYNLNVENGLIQSQATSIAQDKYGHLWIGTLGGLSRYDGRVFTNYTVRNGMTTNTVSKVAVDNMGNIWVGTPKGISKYDGKSFRHFVFQSPENPSSNSVSSIQVADNGVVYCIAGNKVYSIVNGKSQPLNLPRAEDSVSSILASGKDLWIATTKGIVYSYQNSKWQRLAFNEPQLKGTPHVWAMYKDSKGRVWLGTNGGLYTIDSNRIKIARLKGNTPLYGLPSIFSITEDKYNNIWLGASSGAYRIKDSTLAYCSKSNGLTDNTIFQVLADAEGNIWMASDGQGVFRFSGAQFSVVDESTGLPSAQVMSIAAQGQRLYFGTYDAGLYTYENGGVYKVNIPVNTTITALQPRNMYDMWIGSRGGGLWRYDGIIFKSYTKPTLPSNFVTCLYRDAGGRMWVGFDNGAVYYQNDTFHRVRGIYTTIQDIITLGSDSILFATNDGLKLYSMLNDETINYKTNAAPDSATPQCFTISGHNLWIGTSDNGAICYNLKTGKSFTLNKGNGLQSDFIYNIITDNDGNVWTGTGYGIHKITMRDNTPIIQFYGRGQGITGMESNHNAVYKMPDGSIWFGTTNGAVHYNPQSKFVTPKPASIVLQSVKVFGENIGDSSYYDSLDAWYNVPHHLRLPYRKNNITFNFQAITLTGGEQVRYRYRIAGLDAPWSDWSNINTVTYSALPPGKYTLMVEAIAGNNEVAKLSYPFEIITPFHKTGWFRLVILLGCILLGVTIQYIVNKRKQNRMALLERLRREEQNKVRERTAEDFHDEVGNKLTRINVLTNVLKNKIGHVTPDTQRILDQIQDNTGQLYSGTRDILWSLKPSNDSLYEILHRIRDFGGELFQDTDIDFFFNGTDERWQHYKLPLDSSRNLIMIFKEALNNCLKYSKATRVSMLAELKAPDILHIELKDNGQGFDMDTVKKGHGVNNMNVRANRLHGKLYIDTRIGKGTIISLSFRLPPKM